MSTGRIALQIDVFEKVDQPALALPHLKPRQLVEAILGEFTELKYLGRDPEQYYLVKPGGEPLDEQTPVGQQLQAGDRLTVVEREPPLPEGTARPSQPVYFREAATETTYAVHWQPAIIGRASDNLPDNELVAVDLKGLGAGALISRRHARLTEDTGRFLVQGLSTNPLFLCRAASRSPADNGSGPGVERTPLTPESEPQELYPGDLLVFERANVELEFVVRLAAMPPER